MHLNRSGYGEPDPLVLRQTREPRCEERRYSASRIASAMKTARRLTRSRTPARFSVPLAARHMRAKVSHSDRIDSPLLRRNSASHITLLLAASRDPSGARARSTSAGACVRVE